jgi:hypothetical protein
MCCSTEELGFSYEMPFFYLLQEQVGQGGGGGGEGGGDNLTTEHRWRLSDSDEDLGRQRERTGRRRPRVSSPPLSAGDLAGGNWSPPPSAAVLLRAQVGQQ